MLRVEVVVFNRIAGAQDVRVFQPGHRAHQLVLDVKRQTGRNTVRVVLVCVQAFRLQKDLVALLVGKAVDLVLYAGAIARPYPLDLAGEHRAAVKATADDLVRARIGVRHPARHLRRVLFGPPQKTEHRHLGAHAARHAVTRLFLTAAEIDGAAVQPGRRASLEAALRQLELFEPGAQRHGRRVARAAGRVIVQPNVDLAV